MRNRAATEIPTNAHALHMTILQQIEYAAKHHTVMHRIIAESGGWQTADSTLHERRASVARQHQFAGMQIGNLTKVIAEGGNFRSLMLTLQEVEERQSTLAAELAGRTQIHQSLLKRATAEQVQEFWSAFTELWPELTDEEKREMIALVVKRVEVKEKRKRPRVPGT